MGYVRGSDAVFPTNASRPQRTRGEYELSTHKHCMYDHDKKLPTMGKENPSGPKHTY